MTRLDELVRCTGTFPIPNPPINEPMKKFILASALAAGCTLGAFPASHASAQSAVLADTYGRGIHTYFAGDYNTAYLELSAAINGGLAEPLAYYFRGMSAAASGRMAEAEADWSMGAELEAQGKISQPIGRALTRFQGRQRMKLEEIRRNVKLRYLAQANARSEKRYGEIDAARGEVLRSSPAAVTPPPAPAAAAPADDPFAANAVGDPKVDASDALEGAMEDPFKDEEAAMAASDTEGTAAPAADPFGGDAKPNDDPFGDGGGSADPFGGDDGAMDKSDPFGGPAGDDPFGSSPF